jgi:YfiH family protein
MVEVVILRSALLEDAGFRHGFAERSADADAIAEALGVSRIIQVKQVHGSRTLEATAASPEAEADAVVGRATRDPIAVGVRTADCVSVLVADVASGDVAAIHAGWRGVVAGVVQGAMSQLGGRALLAAIGPCIGRCCFEVDRSIAEAIANASAGADVLFRLEGDKAWVDLRAAVRAQLSASAREATRVVVDDIGGCTRHEPTRFHSFRRDGERSGRMLAAIRPRVPA